MVRAVSLIILTALAAFTPARAAEPDGHLIGRWTCPIGTGGTETTFDITAVSPSISGTVSGKNSNPKYPPQWEMRIGNDTGMVRAVPRGSGIDFTMPSGSTYSNFHISNDGAAVDFKSAIEKNSRALACAKK